MLQHQLGRLLLLEKRYVEAEDFLVRGYQALTKQNTPPADALRSVQDDLAALYKALGQRNKAEKFRPELSSDRSRSSRPVIPSSP